MMSKVHSEEHDGEKSWWCIGVFVCTDNLVRIANGNLLAIE